MNTSMNTSGEHPSIEELPTQPMPTLPPAKSATAAVGSPGIALGEVGRLARRVWGGAVRPRDPLLRALLAVNAVLLLVALLVPALFAISTATAGNPWAGFSQSPGATVAAGSASPGALGWTGSLQNAAETAYVNDLIAHMSLDEEVGQMLVTDFIGTDVTPELATKIEQYHIGGAILYNRNYYSAASLRQLTTHMQADAKIPLLIGVDQEGGTVDRMAVIDGSRPSAEAMGNRNDPAYVRQIGVEDGQSMYSLGVNVNLAPVVDVQNVPDSQTYMAYRMFGWTPDKVATMAGAYLDGLQSQHVIGTLKHFPGLGDIGGNPHTLRVVQTRSLDDLNRIDWAPYRTLLATGQVGMIMTTHVIVNAVDPSRPTTVSYPVTTGILRQQLGFQGVIITDDIYMDSLMSWSYSLTDRVIGSVLAGDDLIASVFTLDATEHAFEILKNAVANGTITKARIDESVRRILLLKLQYGLIKMPAK